MKYFLKRGRWCIRDGVKTYKFNTEEEAAAFVKSNNPVPYVQSNALHELSGVSVSSVSFDTEVDEEIIREETV
jgi:hypothetical protein